MSSPMTSPKDPKQVLRCTECKQEFDSKTEVIIHHGRAHSVMGTTYDVIGIPPISLSHRHTADKQSIDFDRECIECMKLAHPLIGVSSSRLGDEANYARIDTPSKDCLQCRGTGNYTTTLTSTHSDPMVQRHICPHADLESEANRGITEQSEVAEVNGTAGTPNPDSEGELGHEFRGVLADLYIAARGGGRAQPLLNESAVKLKALIHRRELEARIEELLTVDDEARLHNTVGDHYQRWFTERLRQLRGGTTNE